MNNALCIIQAQSASSHASKVHVHSWVPPHKSISFPSERSCQYNVVCTLKCVRHGNYRTYSVTFFYLIYVSYLVCTLFRPNTCTQQTGELACAGYKFIYLMRTTPYREIRTRKLRVCFMGEREYIFVLNFSCRRARICFGLKTRQTIHSEHLCATWLLIKGWGSFDQIRHWRHQAGAKDQQATLARRMPVATPMLCLGHVLLRQKTASYSNKCLFEILLFFLYKSAECVNEILFF
jgi:hypothetical protein